MRIKCKNIKRIKVQSTKRRAAEFSRKTSPERISGSVTPTVTTRNKTNPSADEKRFPSTIAPLYLAQLRPPLVLSRVRALPPPRYPPWLPSLLHGIPRIDSINSFARAMRALSSPYFPSFRCPPLPFLHRRFVWQRQSRLAHPHDKRDFANVICGIYFCAGILFMNAKKGKNIEMAFYLRKSIPKAFSYLIYQYRYFKRDV